ncbi:hypothetical protein AAE478_007284 [Parahypoxylon ruwenzoriense]
MSEYWKSTPKYWCKHCSSYVRDTKLERTNHEATAKHQGALKRFLRDLHRGHDQELREKERAKREIERLNGVVGTSSSDDIASAGKAPAGGRIPIPHPSPAQATSAQRQTQWEQLAEMGIDVPTELRGSMAMAGKWTVTSTRVIGNAPTTNDPDVKPQNIDANAPGSRKRQKREEEEEEEKGGDENVIKGLFKKPKKWGRDTKQAPEDDAELDALLHGTLSKQPKVEEQVQYPMKSENDLPKMKREDSSFSIKTETDDDQTLPSAKPISRNVDTIPIKQEECAERERTAVVFKKRKPKNIRQR